MLSIKEYYKRNYEMVTESFQCNLLRELQQQLKLRVKNNEEENEWAGNVGKDIKSTFKYIFSKWEIKWDAITDDMVKKCSTSNDNDIKEANFVLSNRGNTYPAAIILVNENKDVYPKYTGTLVKKYGEVRYYSFISDMELSSDPKKLKLNEVTHMLTNTFYIINLSGLSSTNLKLKRSQDKNSDQYYTSKESRTYAYERILKNNKTRYKAYTEKMKAQQQANDGIPEKVNEYMQKVTELLEKMSKNPIMYAKFEYNISSIMDSLNETKKWQQGRTWKDQSGYVGNDGLLTVYKRYVTKKLALAGGSGSNTDKETLKQAKEEINKICERIDKRLEEINSKIAA